MAKTIKITIEEEKTKKTPAKKKKPTSKQLKCAYCKGKGRDPFIYGAVCKVCDGKVRVPPDRTNKCPYCDNTGIDPTIYGARCKVCDGWGYIK